MTKQIKGETHTRTTPRQDAGPERGDADRSSKQAQIESMKDRRSLSVMARTAGNSEVKASVRKFMRVI